MKRFDLGNHVESSPAMQLEIDHGEGLQPGAEARGRTSHPLGDGAHLPMSAGEDDHDAVGLPQLIGAQDDGLIPVEPLGHAQLRPVSAARG